jgi:hypothetical protein
MTHVKSSPRKWAADVLLKRSQDLFDKLRLLMGGTHAWLAFAALVNSLGGLSRPSQRRGLRPNALNLMEISLLAAYNPTFFFKLTVGMSNARLKHKSP